MFARNKAFQTSAVRQFRTSTQRLALPRFGQQFQSSSSNLPVCRAKFTNALVVQARHLSLSRNNSRIERAYKDADNSPNDAGRQSRLLSLLNEHKEHGKAISRFENFGSRVTMDEACVREYIKALVFTGRFDHTNLGRLMSQYVSHAQHMSASSSGSPAHDLHGSPGMMPMMRLDHEGPIRVSISETNKSNFWKLIRSG